VTIFGQSGGGGKVSTLLGAPSARGLFHRAIAERRIHPFDRAKMARSSRRRCQAARPYTRAARRIAEPAVQTGDRGHRPGAEDGGPPASPFDRYDFGPVVDGAVLPGHPYDLEATAISADIPVLVGNVKDEMAIYLAPEDKIWNRSCRRRRCARVAPVAGAATDRVVETYRRLFPATPSDRLISTLTDRTSASAARAR
jgi:para-nitrobenzyl esterase